MVEDGFGDINLSCTDFSLSHLFKEKIPCTPMFMMTKDKPPCSVNKITTLDKCLCDRFEGKPVKPWGSYDSKYCFVGRDPGEQEVEHGIPFYPEAPGGNLLLEYFEALAINRESCYITNAVFCREGHNIPPSPDHIHGCMAFHKAEFKKLKNLKYIFPLGSHAFQAMTSVFASITPYIGTYFETKLFGRDITIIPLHHPGFILRRPREGERIFKILRKLSGLE